MSEIDSPIDSKPPIDPKRIATALGQLVITGQKSPTFGTTWNGNHHDVIIQMVGLAMAELGKSNPPLSATEVIAYKTHLTEECYRITYQKSRENFEFLQANRDRDEPGEEVFPLVDADGKPVTFATHVASFEDWKKSDEVVYQTIVTNHDNLQISVQYKDETKDGPKVAEGKVQKKADREGVLLWKPEDLLEELNTSRTEYNGVAYFENLGEKYTEGNFPKNNYRNPRMGNVAKCAEDYGKGGY